MESVIAQLREMNEHYEGSLRELGKALIAAESTEEYRRFVELKARADEECLRLRKVVEELHYIIDPDRYLMGREYER